MYLLESQIWLPRPLEEVFIFFSDAKNLQKITPVWLDFRVVGMSTPTIQPSTLIDYRLKIRGIPIRWRSEIALWEPPTCFVDRQVTGPYAQWIHEHRFEPQPNGVLMTDQVTYALPFGPLGDLVHAFYVRRRLAYIFDYRREKVNALFASPSQTLDSK